MNARVVNLAQAFGRIEERWSPRIAGDLNESHAKLAKLAKLEGEFVWHHHAHEDELFLVIAGTLRMKLREPDGEREVTLRPGEFLIVPKGIEHLPIADEVVEVVLIEPKTTINTGNLRNERTREDLGTV